MGRLDRQRRRHRLPHRALPGLGLHELHPDRDHDRHRTTYKDTSMSAVDQLQLPRPRHRRRRQPEPVLEHCQRHHAVTGHHSAVPPGSLTATAVSSGEVDLSWSAATDNVGVTGYDDRALLGRRAARQLRADRRDIRHRHDVKDTTVVRVDQLQLPGPRVRRRGQRRAPSRTPPTPPRRRLPRPVWWRRTRSTRARARR